MLRFIKMNITVIDVVTSLLLLSKEISPRVRKKKF